MATGAGYNGTYTASDISEQATDVLGTTGSAIVDQGALIGLGIGIGLAFAALGWGVSKVMHLGKKR